MLCFFCTTFVIYWKKIKTLLYKTDSLLGLLEGKGSLHCKQWECCCPAGKTKRFRVRMGWGRASPLCATFACVGKDLHPLVCGLYFCTLRRLSSGSGLVAALNHRFIAAISINTSHPFTHYFLSGRSDL